MNYVKNYEHISPTLPLPFEPGIKLQTRNNNSNKNEQISSGILLPSEICLKEFLKVYGNKNPLPPSWKKVENYSYSLGKKNFLLAPLADIVLLMRFFPPFFPFLLFSEIINDPPSSTKIFCLLYGPESLSYLLLKLKYLLAVVN